MYMVLYFEHKLSYVICCFKINGYTPFAPKLKVTLSFGYFIFNALFRHNKEFLSYTIDCQN